MILVFLGTGHSPAAPAQRIRSPCTKVTALGTGARPVPSHRVAPTSAVDGGIGSGSGGRTGVPPQAAASRPSVARIGVVESVEAIRVPHPAVGRRLSTSWDGGTPGCAKDAIVLKGER